MISQFLKYFFQQIHQCLPLLTFAHMLLQYDFNIHTKCLISSQSYRPLNEDLHVTLGPDISLYDGFLCVFATLHSLSAVL